jgi:putative peptidoglycan lipid II flippase
VAVPVARLLVEGAPGSGSVDALADALTAFAPGLLGYGVLALLSRALYARGRGRSAGVAVVVGWCGVAVADVLLVLLLPQAPVVVLLGVGNTVGLTLGAVLLVLALRRSGAGSSLAGAGRTTATALLAALTAAAVGLLLPGPQSPGLAVELVAGGACAVAALLVYAGAVRLLDPSALREVARAGG